MHINCLELLAVYQSLKHLLSWLKGHHVLVRSDASTVMAYINRNGDLRSRRLHTGPLTVSQQSSIVIDSDLCLENFELVHGFWKKKEKNHCPRDCSSKADLAAVHSVACGRF